MEEKFGTLPAVAIGYRFPARRTPDWYAMSLLDHVLHGGRAGRFYRRLVLEQQLAVEAAGDGDPFDYNGPLQLVTRVIYKPKCLDEQIMAAYDAIVEDIRSKGIEADELEHVKVKFRAEYFSSLEGGHGPVSRDSD